MFVTFRRKLYHSLRNNARTFDVLVYKYHEYRPKMKSCYYEDMKSFSKQSIILTAVFVLLVAQAAGLYLLWDKQSNTITELTATEQLLTEQASAIEANRMMALNEVQSEREAIQPFYNPAKNSLLLPELGIELPYNETTKTLRYVVDGENIRITSTLLVDYSYSRSMSCTQALRVNFTSDEVYNPWEELAATVDLSDGRKMHLLNIKAFKNNEGSTQECADEVWNRITPKQLVDEFKSATIL